MDDANGSAREPSAAALRDAVEADSAAMLRSLAGSFEPSSAVVDGDFGESDGPDGECANCGTKLPPAGPPVCPACGTPGRR